MFNGKWCYRCERYPHDCKGEKHYKAMGKRYGNSRFLKKCANRLDTPNTPSPLQVDAFRAIYKTNLVKTGKHIRNGLYRREFTPLTAFVDAILATSDDRLKKLQALPGGVMAGVKP